MKLKFYFFILSACQALKLGFINDINLDFEANLGRLPKNEINMSENEKNAIKWFASNVTEDLKFYLEQRETIEQNSKNLE